MGIRSLDVAQTSKWLIQVSRAMIDEEERLTRADQAIGDGDHGIGMSRGFHAVCQQLEQAEFQSLDGLYGAVGRAMLMSVGGAAGAIFGTLFMGGARRLAGQVAFDAPALADLLEGGLCAVQERGKAKVGDKTVVDVLEPAADMARTVQGQDLDQALVAVVRAAKEGLESTKLLQARIGKARSLGERALGYVDPGALSLALILEHMIRLLPDIVRD
jgi:dihydroxyacetone kinase-like protein